MCGFYDNNQKIKKGEKARYNGKDITIISATHLKENKTMDIKIVDNLGIQTTVNIPYKTTGFGFEFISN